MVGSMRSCVADGRTDGQTDGAGYIGPAEGYGGSKKDTAKNCEIADKSCKPLFRYESKENI